MGRHVKSAEQLGLEVGYTDSNCQYAAAFGRLGTIIELIAFDLDELWSTPGLTYRDYHATLLNIERLVQQVTESR